MTAFIICLGVWCFLGCAAVIAAATVLWDAPVDTNSVREERK